MPGTNRRERGNEDALEGYAWPTGTPTRFPAPEGAKACPMPPDNGFRLYDREGVQNTRRDPVQADEDHTIEVAEDRALR